ncbi:sugar-binding domain-containing protein [Erwinia sp. E_sp_B01_9]|uniref:sugar-binding domain-containing protein n=1 Tax=Erwinia sp. E_sp_B01_9 TaxID=3039403 RepID=UPI003D9AE494
MALVEPAAQLVEAGMIQEDEIRDISASGAVGEILGHFIDKKGYQVTTPLTSRTVAVSLGPNHRERIVAIAGGPGKIEAIRAVLKGGILHGLITDELTAEALLTEEQSSAGMALAERSSDDS